jgi:aspartyl-tRNA(Asn)/glutamyl-tRNA(Gln) amidotransferase subunit A
MPLSFTLDTVGPLALSAEDCALIGAVISGADPLDPTTSGAPAWNMAATQRTPKEMTIGVPRKFYIEDLESDVATSFDEAIATFRSQGARLVEVSLPDQAAISAAALIVLAVEATSHHAPWLRERAGEYGAQVRNRLQNGLAYSAVEYLEALRLRGPALAAHLAAINGVDVVIAPTARAAAPTIEETDVGGGPGAEAAIQAITRFMRPINYLGLPVLEIPAGQSRSGMPIGLQLIGRPFDDETAIALGRAFQTATNHHRRIPVLA